jgi:molybdate transport system substrate-binding protein
MVFDVAFRYKQHYISSHQGGGRTVAVRPLLRSLFLVVLTVVAGELRAEEPVRVFAAASLTNALGDIAAQWQKAGHPAPSLAFGASSTLAKQIEAGAPADVFASADLSWMDYLGSRERIVSGSRVDLLGNDLVLIVPKGHRFPVTMTTNFDLARSFSGKLCTGEPGVVPVGNYARQSLEHYGWWAGLAGRIVGTDDARTALVFVERGECPLGIVFATDAAISDKVEVLARFPPESHQPILYPLAIVRDARPDAQAFLDFLRGSPEAAAIFRHYGFSRLAH